MHTMLDLFEHINDRIESAECYAKCAIKHKDSDRELADVYITIARTDLDQCARLRAQASRLANAKVNEIGVTAELQELCDWYNAKMAQMISKVKLLIESYK